MLITYIKFQNKVKTIANISEIIIWINFYNSTPKINVLFVHIYTHLFANYYY